METGVVGGGWGVVHFAHVVELPGGEDEKGTSGAGFEALALGFPKGGDGFLLQVDEGVAFVEAFLLEEGSAF